MCIDASRVCLGVHLRRIVYMQGLRSLYSSFKHGFKRGCYGHGRLYFVWCLVLV